MYCRNCGEPLNDNQAICLKCGVKTGDGSSFCWNCGKRAGENVEVCLQCGVSLKKAKQNNLNGQDKTAMAILSFFLGGLGIHNFVMGEKKKGITKILFSCLCGIGGILALIDFVQILTDSYQYNPDSCF